MLYNRVNVAIKYCFLVFGICLLLLITRIVDINWYGYGVDSSGRVYVGFSSYIGVFQENVLVGKVEIPTYRTYAFTTQDGELIILSNTQQVFTMDLSGRVLDASEDTQCNTYESLRLINNVTNGDKHYIRNDHLLRTRIIDEHGAIYYQMPLLDYVIKLILIGSIICIVVLSPFDVYKKIKDRM